MEFGITTASGATISSVAQFAGGGTKSFVAGRLRNGVTVAITSEQRASPLYAFVDCAFVTPTGNGDPDVPNSSNSNGALILVSDWGGGAAGCSHGTLFVYQERPAGQGRENVLETPVTIARDGRTATLGTTTTLIHGLDTNTHPAEVQHYSAATCGNSTVLHPTF